MSQQNPIVIIKNNTGADVPVMLFQYGGTPSSNNATREFRYATPASVFLNASKVTIQVRGGSAVPFQTYSAPVGALTPQGVVNALNGLNLGTSWYTKQIGGNTFIITDNNGLEFGDLTLDDPSPVTISFDLDVADAGGQIKVDALTGGGTANIINVVPPIITSVSTGFSAGVIIAFEITPPATTILRLLVTKQTTAGTVTIISDIIDPGTTATPQFTVAADALSYSVSIEQPVFWTPLQGGGMIVFGVEESNIFPETPPLAPFTLDDTVQAYIWVEIVPGVPVWNSNVIPYPTTPDFSGNLTDGITAWVQEVLLVNTGDAPAGDPAVDAPVLFFLGYGTGEDTFLSKVITFIGNAYNMGNMALSTGTAKNVRVKFSKFT